MYIIGISAFYHDSAISLMEDGKILFSAQEERFTRVKHDRSFPVHAINKALEFESITIQDIDLICFYEKPFQKFERIIDSFALNSPKGFISFKKAMKSWLSQKLWVPDVIKKELGYKGKIIFSNHHESHSASAFFASPFRESVIVTLDGVGERETATIGIGIDNKINIIETQHFPHSLGLFYSAVTYYCGFKVNSGEYKLMGLAPYGEPKYVELMQNNFIKINNNGSIELNLKYFNFEVGLRMINSSFEKVMGEKRRNSETSISQFYKDVAASAQVIVQQVLLKTVKYAMSLSGQKNVCLAGGVALNCKANSELFDFIKPENIWIQPASGDSGGAIGSAYVAWYHYLKNERKVVPNLLKNQVYLGTSYLRSEVKEKLNDWNIDYSELSDLEILKFISNCLNQKKIVGWFNGRMEFGPRALGNRSILASPAFSDMKEYLNLKIKMREAFRPFAPIVKEEKVGEWFNIDSPNKDMMCTYSAIHESKIPSCVHEDETSRVQTINEEDNKLIYGLIDEFEKLSGVPILINTSFNVRGEPIVESPDDALNCFFNTGIDILVIEGIIIEKEKNINQLENFNLKQYELD